MSTPSKEIVIEGTWDEIVSHASEFNGYKLRLTILAEETNESIGTMIYEGMFPQLLAVNAEDFNDAKFHGYPNDGLNLNR